MAEQIFISYSNYLNHFTQPDTIVPDQYNSQGWDRYSYANNNPLKYTDPSGHRPDDGCRTGEGCNLTQKIIDDDKRKENEFRQRTEYLQCWAGDTKHCSGFDKAIIALDNLNLGDGTIQIGLGINGFMGPGIRGDVAVAIDFKGNVALLATGGGGGYTAAGGGFGPYLAVTNAPSVEYLRGNDVQIGGQVGEVGTVGTEMILFRGSDRERYSGLSISGAARFQGPWPGEIHTTFTHTGLVSINIPDLIVNIFRP